jgi:hypothetical protein
MNLPSWGSLIVVALGVLALVICIAVYALLVHDEHDRT